MHKLLSEDCLQRYCQAIITAKLCRLAALGWLAGRCRPAGIVPQAQAQICAHAKRPCPTLLCGCNLHAGQVPRGLLWVVPLPLACNNTDHV